MRPPDLLVSDDAKLIALHQDGRLLIARRTGASKFTLEAYEHFWATMDDPVMLPVDGRHGSVVCDATTCRLSRDGMMVLLPLDEASVPDCTGAALVVAAFPLRQRCDGVAHIDRFSVWRDGAEAVWIRSRGVQTVSDRAWRGSRPWVPPVPVSRRQFRTPALPSAIAE